MVIHRPFDKLGAMLPLLARRLLATAILRLFRTEATITDSTADHLRKGGRIVCANHVSLLDGPLIALASPIPMLYAVDSDYSVKSVGASFGLRLLERLGFGTVVPLDMGSPFGMRRILQALKEGQNVMIFPEGGISPDGHPQSIMPGLKWLQEKSGAETLWLQISGAEKSLLFSKAGKELWPSIRIDFGNKPSSDENHDGLAANVGRPITQATSL